MRIHHLNCATMRPPLAPMMVAHVLLLETERGLVLVDTGLGTGDLADPGRLGRGFRALVRPSCDVGETALAQVRALGFAAREVTDIALTHLDLDHAGGLGDFPNARVHVHAHEIDAARRPAPSERARYVAAQWAHNPTWVTYAEGGDRWFGFDGVHAMAEDIVLVPLPGHTRGHNGVAVRRSDGHWLLHAGDAFFAAGQLASTPTCPASLRAFQRVVAADNRRRVANLARLHELAQVHGEEVTVFCAHDRDQYETLAQSSR